MFLPYMWVAQAHCKTMQVYSSRKHTHTHTHQNKSFITRALWEKCFELITVLLQGTA